MRKPRVDLGGDSILQSRLKICKESADLRFDHDCQIVPDMLDRAREPGNRIRSPPLLIAHRALLIDDEPKLRGKEFKTDGLSQNQYSSGTGVDA